MNIRRMNLTELKPAEHNPRKDLQPEDAEYQKIKRSLESFTLVEPLIWNEKTGHLVGGHQRIKVMQELGYTETEVSVVSLDEKDEKILCILLNRAKGRWDNPKLAELITELSEEGDISLTGFDEWELQGLIDKYEKMDDILSFMPPETLPDDEEQKTEETFTMTFAIPIQYKEIVESFISRNESSLQELAAAVMESVEGEG